MIYSLNLQRCVIKCELKYAIIKDPDASHSASHLTSITTAIITFPPTAAFPAKTEQSTKGQIQFYFYLGKKTDEANLTIRTKFPKNKLWM